MDWTRRQDSFRRALRRRTEVRLGEGVVERRGALFTVSGRSGDLSMRDSCGRGAPNPGLQGVILRVQHAGRMVCRLTRFAERTSRSIGMRDGGIQVWLYRLFDILVEREGVRWSFEKDPCNESRRRRIESHRSASFHLDAGKRIHLFNYCDFHCVTAYSAKKGTKRLITMVRYDILFYLGHVR
jgi:hypothetical protein